MIKTRGRIVPESYEELCSMWDEYHTINGEYPNSIICQTDFNLPAWSRVKTLCGDRLGEFYYKYGTVKYDIEKYDEYCEEIIELSKTLKRSPRERDIRKTGTIPDYRWLIKNCKDENVKSYNDLLVYLNLKPTNYIPKDIATRLIREKQRKLGRKLLLADFKNVSSNEIGYTTINNIWGSFNDMMIDLGFGINQIGMSTLEKSIEELQSDVILLCDHILTTENRRVITVRDINGIKGINNWGTFDRRFKKELGTTLVEYINSIGFETNKSGMGTVIEHYDGEITTSIHEFEFTSILKSKNIRYERNVKYKEFIDNYSKNKDCDYVLHINGIKVYVEIAGMLEDYKSIDNASRCNLDKIHYRYLNDLIDKEEMLKRSNLPYLILFPCDLEYLDIEEEINSFFHS